MTLEEIIEQCWEDSGQWFPVNTQTAIGADNHISFLMLALTGEVGEACNVWKKYLRGSEDGVITLPMLREELIDVFIYFCNLAKVLNINVEEEYAAKRAYNRTRFGRHPDLDLDGNPDNPATTGGGPS
jgi:NTP pyrophosphatase (non-canonical NTP hydrolase)